MTTYTCPSTGKECSESQFQAEVAAQQAIIAQQQADAVQHFYLVDDYGRSIPVTAEQFYANKALAVQAVANGMTGDQVAYITSKLATVDVTKLGPTDTMYSALKTQLAGQGWTDAQIQQLASQYGSILSLTKAQTELLFANQLMGYTSKTTASGTISTPTETASSLPADVIAWALYENMNWDAAQIAKATNMTVDQVNTLLASTTEKKTTTAGVADVNQTQTKDLTQHLQALQSQQGAEEFPIVPVVIIAVISVAAIAAYLLIPKGKTIRRG